MVNQYTSKEAREKFERERIGKRFAKLVVLRRTGTDKHGNTLWLCQCDCGNKKVISMSSLITGHTKSCGCLNITERIIDIRGKKFGRWTVLNETHISKKRGALWKCKCECGTIKEVNSDGLRDGQSTSCGCSFRLEEGESSFNWLLNHWKKQALERGYEWKLSKEDVKIITKMNCFHCGCKPAQNSNRSKHARAFGDYIYNTLDRLDNNKGYTKENAVPSCYECNRIKSDKTVEEFNNHVEKIYLYNKQKKK